MQDHPDHRYDDIIHLDRPVSPRHAPMPRQSRAAQFSPFAALTGYDAVIREAARLTAEPIVLGEDSQAELNRRLVLLAEAAGTCPSVEITWFEPDGLKLGGEYRTETVTVRRVDAAFGLIELADRSLIPIDRISDLRGPLFLDAE
ncbi:MAG: hypothetical protein IJU06_04655 [Oscillospiraceae bacterium]|nr:hypothetical protein [Oscillospiraceae bacterium]